MNYRQAQAAWELLQIEKVKKAEAEKKIAEDFVRELQIKLHEKNVRIEKLEEELKKKPKSIVNNITIHVPAKPLSESVMESLRSALKDLNMNG